MISSVFMVRASKELAVLQEAQWTWIHEQKGYVGDGLVRWNAIIFQTAGNTQAVYRAWRVANFSMSIMINIVTAAMIGARVVFLERKMKRLAQQSGTFQPNLPYRKVLGFLLESAIPFTLVGISGAICAGFLDLQSNMPNGALFAYPLLIVLWTNGLVCLYNWFHRFQTLYAPSDVGLGTGPTVYHISNCIRDNMDV